MLAAEGVWRRAMYFDRVSRVQGIIRSDVYLQTLCLPQILLTASLSNLTFFHGALWFCVAENRDCETAR